MTGIFYMLLQKHRGWTDTEIRVSTKGWPWRRKFSRHSCRDSNPPLYHFTSSTLTTEPCQLSKMNIMNIIISATPTTDLHGTALSCKAQWRACPGGNPALRRCWSSSSSVHLPAPLLLCIVGFPPPPLLVLSGSEPACHLQVTNKTSR